MGSETNLRRDHVRQGNSPLTLFPVDGVVLVDKPAGVGSNAVLQHVRRLYGARKAGHTGTLDPLASGLLPLCLGEATKFAQALLDAPKRYTATVRFGITTKTGDAEGAVTAVRPVAFDAAALDAALLALTGRIAQVPPAYSALKRAGRPYYDYARAGIEIERAPRTVEVHALRLLALTGVEATLDVQCGKGTYIRTLAEDLGERLGCGAHLAALRRTESGGFRVADAHTPSALEAMDAAARLAALRPVDALLAMLPRVDLEAAVALAITRGQRPERALAAGRYRAYGPDGVFVGVVAADEHLLRAVRLLDTRTNATAGEAEE